jgi:hypothetical protein
MCRYRYLCFIQKKKSISKTTAVVFCDPDLLGAANTFMKRNGDGPNQSFFSRPVLCKILFICILDLISIGSGSCMSLAHTRSLHSVPYTHVARWISHQHEQLLLAIEDKPNGVRIHILTSISYARTPTIQALELFFKGLHVNNKIFWVETFLHNGISVWNGCGRSWS